MKQGVFIIITVLFLTSCNSKQPVIDQILLSVPDKPAEHFFFSNFELENIVSIETTDEFLISAINNGVIYHKEKLIIADKGTTSIFVIDANTGRVETHIHRKGRGPGDSNNIMSIAFDDERERILVFNDYKKLLFFGLDGSFLKEEQITDDLFNELVYYKGKVIFYDAVEGYGSFPYYMGIYNLNNQSWEKIGNRNKVDFPHRELGRVLVKSKNIWFTPLLDFGLHLLKDGKIEVPYRIDHERLSEDLIKRSSVDLIQFSNEINEKDIMYGIHSIRETGNFIIFMNNRYGFFIFDKNKPELHWETGSVDKHLGLEVWNYFPHDGDDGRVMFIVSAYEWLEERSPQNMDNIPEHLRKKIDNIKVNEESNPILLFYKEK